MNGDKFIPQARMQLDGRAILQVVQLHFDPDMCRLEALTRVAGGFESKFWVWKKGDLTAGILHEAMEVIASQLGSALLRSGGIQLSLEDLL